MSQASVSVKVHYDDTEIRRFSCTGYQDFQEKVQKFSPFKNHEKLNLKYYYLDEDKDYVMFESVGEWDEGIVHHFGKVMKIKVEKEGKKVKASSEEKEEVIYSKPEEADEIGEEYPREEEEEVEPFFKGMGMFGGRGRCGGRGCCRGRGFGRGFGRGMGMCGRGHGWRHGWGMGNGRGRGHHGFGFGFGGRGHGFRGRGGFGMRGHGFGMRGHGFGRGMWKRDFREGEFMPGHMETRCNWMDVPPQKIGVFRKIGRCRKQIATIEFKLEKNTLSHQEKMTKIEEKINYLLDNTKPGKEKEINEKVMKLKTKLLGIENSLKKKTEALNLKKNECVEKMKNLMQKMKEDPEEKKDDQKKEDDKKEKVTVVIPEETKVPNAPDVPSEILYPEGMFSKLLQLLTEMGFKDEKATKDALKEANGNVAETVKIIMDLPRNTEK